MFLKVKNTFQILCCAALALQLGGCIFVDHDHHYHHDHPVPVHEVVYVH